MTHHTKTPERAPFIRGYEPVKLSAKELRELNSRVGMADRNIDCVEAVIVKRLSFVDAGKLLNEKPSYVRGAYLWGLKRLGLDGSKAFAVDPTNRLIVDDVPARFHGLLSEKIRGQVDKWLEQERADSAPQWQSLDQPQLVEAQDVD